jgi:HEAT repeat protein/beta-lactamase regulating signal transducer with metallopeptidase domain
MVYADLSAPSAPKVETDTPPVKVVSKMALDVIADPSRVHDPAVEWPSWWTIGMIVWLLGIAAILSRLVIGSTRVWLVTRRADPASEISWTSLYQRLAADLELNRSASVFKSKEVRMPLTCGVLRSVVLLPPEADDWSLARREVVLLHELAHVKRRDCLTQMVAHLVCALYWFNPLIWLAARQLRVEREHACDDQVLHCGTKASDYADHLLELARTLGGGKTSTFAAVAIAKRSQLEGRVLAILDPNVRRRGIGRLKSVLAGAAVIAVVVPLSAVRPLALANDSVETDSEQAAARSKRSGSPAQRSIQTKSSEAVGSTQSKTPDDKKRASEESEFEFEFDVPVDIPVEIPIGLPVNLPVKVDLPNISIATPSESTEPPQTGGSQSPERSKALEALREALKDQDPQIRERAMMALIHAGDKLSLDMFKTALRDPNPQIRSRAVWALALNGDDSVVEPLIAALRDDNAEVRSRAAWGLGLKGDRRAIGPLAAALKDTDGEVRSRAAWALGLKGDSSSVEALSGALKDSSAEVRSQAAWALGLKGNNSAVEPLISALKDQSPEVRAQAAWALGMRGDVRAIDALNAAMKDESKRVREQATWALGMLLMRTSRRVGFNPAATDPGVGGASDPNPDPDKDHEVTPRSEDPERVQPFMLILPRRAVQKREFKTKAT